jgi:hypothetical protein
MGANAVCSGQGMEISLQKYVFENVDVSEYEPQKDTTHGELT